MTSHDQLLAAFRSQIAAGLEDRDKQWEASRRLLDHARIAKTLQHLLERVRNSSLPTPVRESVLTALNHGQAQRIQDLPGPQLKSLTGLPPSKALRALCVFFNLVEVGSRWRAPSLDSDNVLAFLRDHTRPFDILLTSPVPSVLDLGAGDLSFAVELADQYGPPLQLQHKTLLLHCVDRLRPHSTLGGPLHPSKERLQALRSRSDLSFQFLPDQDMCEFDRMARAGDLAARYTIATCWAPATPTFAYESARLSPTVIHQQLTETKGAFRQTRYGGEPALEVQHRGRTLLFPSWKFDIRGPLTLLDVIARSGHLGILGAVDSQVFWELLAQLLEEERFRPKDEPFTSANLPTIFGDVYERLYSLASGDILDLSTCATLRTRLPRVLPGQLAGHEYTFRSVKIRRGAVFPDTPASSTARRFGEMVEEAPPWMMIVVPEP
jgi:hypothetical protein